MSGVPVPLHLAVHLLGLTAATGLAVHAVTRRRGAGPGWRSLVVGGGLLAVSHALAGALVAPDLAWPVYLRAAGYVALAIGGAGGMAGSATSSLAVVVAAAPPAAEVAAGVAGAAAAVASFRGVLRHRRDALVLALGIAMWAASDLVGSAGTFVHAALSLAGSATVGGWLLWRGRESLLARVVASFLVALLLVVVGLSALGGALVGADLQADELERLAEAVEIRTAEVESEWPREVLTIASLFSQDALAAAVRQDDAARLDRLVRSIAELPDVDVVLLVDSGARILSSFVWALEPAGELAAADALLLAGHSLTDQALRGAASTGVVALGESDVLAVGVSPIFEREDDVARRDRQVGALVAARTVSSPVFVQGVASAVDADVTVVVAGDAAASTLPDDDAAAVASAVVRDAGNAVVETGQGSLFLAAAPLGGGTDSAGWIAMTRDATAIAGAERSFTRTLFLLALAGIGVTGLVSAWGVNRTTRPVRRLTAAVEQVAGGDLDVRSGIEQPDEVGRLADAFDRMTLALAERQEQLREAAAVEAALRGRLEVLTASMGEGLVAVDAGGRVQAVNPAAERLLGVDAGRAVGGRVEAVLVGTGPTGTDLLAALGEAGATDVRAVSGVVHRGSETVRVAATAAPLRSDGIPLGRVYVLRDVTGEVEAERMKTEFLSNISHELRTPLTPIKGYAEVLRTRQVPHEQTVEFAANIADSTSRLERIIGMLVDFAALEAGRLRVEFQPTSVADVVDASLVGWRERSPDRRFTRRVERGLPDVHADPRLLARLLDELVDNAIKFSEGPVRVRATKEGDDRVRLTVADEGVGIPAEAIAAASEDFRQADGSVTREYGGLGLGLSLVRRIAERFGAEIVIESEPGTGTDVHLLLVAADGRSAR